ncbi:hypothetical protein L202_08336 [Cryptococcus amylolentus CBS 6039]|uniref:Uncharacterized protein n=2 Tax=Cryptococcus amylolentus TaxID=104669 RepID=A0A1E3H9C2_9TREE|nr:hypothetical protein L202_08336 [Cryptococcus amylolentus CBS 6039]ODN72920.1 hypothetical protein L202_08336 [Cryptococcus amylolentus CBS 6039]ODN98098.1 hypothetical protein I350_07740 [Cryptococcus amylolentus CBS 6273]
MGASLSRSSLATAYNGHSNTSHQPTSSLESLSSLLSSVHLSPPSSSSTSLSYNVTLHALPNLIQSAEEMKRVSVVAKVVGDLVAAPGGLGGEEKRLCDEGVMERAVQEQDQAARGFLSGTDNILPSLHLATSQHQSRATQSPPFTLLSRPTTPCDDPSPAGHVHGPFQCSPPRTLTSYTPRASIQKESLPTVPGLDMIDCDEEVAAISGTIMEKESGKSLGGEGQEQETRAQVFQVTSDCSETIASGSNTTNKPPILISPCPSISDPLRQRITVSSMLSRSDSLESLYSRYATMDGGRPMEESIHDTLPDLRALDFNERAQCNVDAANVSETPKGTKSVVGSQHRQQEVMPDMDSSSSSPISPTVQTPKTPTRPFSTLPIPVMIITPDIPASSSSEIDYFAYNARLSTRLSTSAFEWPSKTRKGGSKRQGMLEVPKRETKIRRRKNVPSKKTRKKSTRRKLGDESVVVQRGAGASVGM